MDLALYNGNYGSIRNYLTALFKNLESFGERYMYKDEEKPVYKAVYAYDVDIEKYKLNKVHIWNGFSICTKKRAAAIDRSRKDKSGQNAFLFEIHLSNKNRPVTSLDLPKGWSFNPGHREVLIKPFFCFQVLGVYQDFKLGATIINIAEVCNQNLI